MTILLANKSCVYYMQMNKYTLEYPTNCMHKCIKFCMNISYNVDFCIEFTEYTFTFYACEFLIYKLASTSFTYIFKHHCLFYK